MMKKISCGRCGYFLGFKTEKEVSIKHKDHYYWFYGGLLLMMCKGCGCTNFTVDEEYEKLAPDFVETVGKRLNVVRANIGVWIKREEKRGLLPHEKQ